ncbi:MAG: hypothetical protein GX201_03040 [Clostridiales bacterium]|nr:hypothetical protein [Clostridiales bacterium]
MIKIRLQVHGHLYWYAGKKNELEVEIEPKDVETILEQIGIPIGEVSFVAIDNKKVGFEYIPNDGDILDVYPVVGGG